MEDKKELYQIARWYESKAIPIDWNRLPDDVISSIPSDFMCNKLSYSREKGIDTKTVLYFRKVKKFRKDIENRFETPEIIFGI
jgi:hypothetical protein